MILTFISGYKKQDGEKTAVTVFPPELTDVVGEKTLREAKGNPDQQLEKLLLL